MTTECEFNGLVHLNKGILTVVDFLFPIILLSGDLFFSLVCVWGPGQKSVAAHDLMR